MGVGLLLVFIAMLLVVLSLVGGLVVMALGGKLNKSWSNRLMTFRVIFQAIAVVLLMAFVMTNS